MIARVFPTRTNATPDDYHAYYGLPPWFATDYDEVHISVLFDWDKRNADILAENWRSVAPVKMGGPAYGDRGGDFIPGQYVKKGYVITSRGCPNKCWFCSVWKREGELRELPITDGWNVLDDNLLACSDEHIKGVFSMLKKQKHPIEFTGGLEAKRLKPWHVEEFTKIKPKQMFFAYDTPDDYEPLVAASKMLFDAGIIKRSSHAARCFVLIGWKKDTIENAEKRLMETLSLGFFPMAMLYRDGKEPSTEWKRFQREWVRPAIIANKASPSFPDRSPGPPSQDAPGSKVPGVRSIDSSNSR